MKQYLLKAAACLILPSSLILSSTATIAHQDLSAGNVEVTVHLQPDDFPYAGQPSLTWFRMTRSDGEAVPLSDCDCNLVVHDSQDQPIEHPPLAETPVNEHATHMTREAPTPIGTNITFPAAGSYELILTGQSRSNAFEPFELKVPVTVRPAAIRP